MRHRQHRIQLVCRPVDRDTMKLEVAVVQELQGLITIKVKNFLQNRKSGALFGRIMDQLYLFSQGNNSGCRKTDSRMSVHPNDPVSPTKSWI